MRNIYIQIYKVVSGFYKKSLNFGSQRLCLLCGAKRKSFLPTGSRSKVLEKYKVIGGGYRPDVICPGCRSSNRERLMYFFLKGKKMFEKRGIKILHFAPEKQLQQKLIEIPGVEYISGDNDLKRSSTKIDVRAISYPENYFDVVICSHVLEHVIEDVQAMGEFYRVLKPGGFAIVQVPISPILTKSYEDISIVDPANRELAFGQNDHVRVYGQDFFERLRSVGFEIELFDVSNFLDNEHIKKYALDPHEHLFVAHKLIQ